MPTDIHALFEMLEAKELRYVVVGGLALVLHGIDRLTADVDLAVDLAPDAAGRLVDALAEAGYRPTAPVDAKLLADPEVRASWHRDRNIQVFSYWDTTGRRPTIDIFIVPPIPFEELWQGAMRIEISSKLRVPVASPARTMSDVADKPPESSGRFDDAEALRRWAFRRRTPAQRLDWLIEMLEIAYHTGAIKPRGPAQCAKEPVGSD